MASRHPRIQVPADPALADAIRQARTGLPAGTPDSQIVRSLALRGAAALEAEQERSAAAREFLISVADGSSGLDLSRLRDVRDRAW